MGKFGTQTRGAVEEREFPNMSAEELCKMIEQNATTLYPDTNICRIENIGKNAISVTILPKEIKTTVGLKGGDARIRYIFRSEDGKIIVNTPHIVCKSKLPYSISWQQTASKWFRDGKSKKNRKNISKL